jgi:hypothetical protein
MAFNAGVTKNTGDLITAAFLNNYLGAAGSIDYLKGRFNWLASSVQVVAQSNKTTDIAYTDVDLTSDTSPTAAFALLQLYLNTDSVNGGMAFLRVRRNGDTPTYVPQILVGPGDTNITDRVPIATCSSVIVGLDAGQVFEYNLDVTGTIQVDAYINLLGYIDG